MKCVLCAAEGFKRFPLCLNCEHRLQKYRIKGQSCSSCGQALWGAYMDCPGCRDDTSRIIQQKSLFRYYGSLRRILSLYKFEGLYSLAGYFLQFIEEEIKNFPKEAIVIPIPPRQGKIYKSGFDQVLYLSDRLSRGYYNLLKRNTAGAQKHLGRKERQSAIKGQFSINVKQLKRLADKNTPLILLDDIRTTGSTLNEAAEVIYNQGCKNISAITLAVDSG